VSKYALDLNRSHLSTKEQLECKKIIKFQIQRKSEPLLLSEKRFGFISGADEVT
jgi:hypothetical protein